jgi:predicted dehydrogenase
VTENADASRIRLGMVGGGAGAFIGVVHRIAARLDDHYELVAGALSSDAERAALSGRQLRLAPDRIYSDFTQMAAEEKSRPDGIQAVTIATPNNLHYPVACAFIEAGIHVICDKPLACSLEEAVDLGRRAKEAGVVFVVTYNNTGYPMVREAREIVASGRIGTIRSVQIEYAQDWLTELLEASGHKQALWREDPAQVGPGACAGDIGTHAFNLMTYVTGLRLNSVMAEVSTFVPGRKMDDEINVLLNFDGGARGSLWASQVAPGNENGLRLRVYGSLGGIEWDGEKPNHLRLAEYGKPPVELTRGGFGISGAANRVTRMPAGLPEGYLECFANVYFDTAELIRAKLRRRDPDPAAVLLPQVTEGIEAVRFVDAVIESGKSRAWVTTNI